MDTKIIYYVLCAAEEKNISKAAEKLFITQPTLSHHISKLEKKLGVQLFDRTTTPLTLTYAGEKFVSIGSKILDSEKQLEQEITDINHFSKGRITIGISAFHGSSLLPMILPKFKDKFPNIEISLVEENAHQLEEITEHGKTDITITNLPINNTNLLYDILNVDEVLLAVHKKFIPPKFSKVSYYNNYYEEKVELSDFKNSPFLLLKSGHKVREIANKIFTCEGICPRILLESSSIETLHNLATIGMGITFIPKSLIHFDNKTNLNYFPLRNPNANYCMVVIYNKNRHLSIPAKKFISVIKKTLHTSISYDA